MGGVHPLRLQFDCYHGLRMQKNMEYLETALSEPFGSLPALIGLHAQHRPLNRAVVLGERSLSYAELASAMERVAARLQCAGLVPGDVIAVCAGTSIEYLLAYLGALRAGVVVAPLAPSATGAHLDAMLANAGARLLFRDADVAAEWVLADASMSCIALDDSDSGIPWSHWLAEGGDGPARAIKPQPDWPFNLIYSSGTTGVPKGIIQSWGMRWAHIKRAKINGYGPDTVSLSATPLYSNTTLVAALPTLGMGGTLVLMRKFDAEEYLCLAQQEGATHTMLVPVQYQRLMSFAGFDAADLSRLTTKFCTSAPFKAALKAEVLRRWPGELVEYYGMTEGGVSCELHCHRYPDKLHTVGRPRDGVDVRFINEAGQELAPGEAGEIVGRSSAMMTGYYRLPDKTREAEWFDAAGQRFIRTGDVGRLDEEGFLVLGDRKKDMIISGGFNIYPSDIEQVLLQHPQVQECAVVGVASAQWGETPVAYAVLRPDESASPAEMQAWLNSRVGKTQRVSALILVPQLPRSEIGKVLKRELREQYGQS